MLAEWFVNIIVYSQLSIARDVPPTTPYPSILNDWIFCHTPFG